MVGFISKAGFTAVAKSSPLLAIRAAKAQKPALFSMCDTNQKRHQLRLQDLDCGRCRQLDAKSYSQTAIIPDSDLVDLSYTPSQLSFGRTDGHFPQPDTLRQTHGQGQLKVLKLCH